MNGRDNYKQKAKIILSFDDARQDQYTAARELLDPLKIPAVFNITSGFVDGQRVFPDIQADPMTWDQIRWLNDSNLFEIAVHGHHHKNDLQDFLRCRKRIFEELNVPDREVIGIASPNSQLTDDFIDKNYQMYQQRGFSYIRTGPRYHSSKEKRKYTNVMERKCRTPARRISRIMENPELYSIAYSKNLQTIEDIYPEGRVFGKYHSVPVMGHTTWGQLEKLVKYTIRKRGICTLMFHSIVKTNEGKAPWSWKWDDFLKLVMYLEEQRSQDSMELVTPKIIRVELDEKQGHQCN